MRSHNSNKESGMVLIIVLMVTIIIMSYSIGILTRGSSQVISAEDQVDRIKSEQLAIGAYAKAYTDLASGNVLPGTFSETLDNKAYTVTVTNAPSTGPNNTDTLTFNSAIPN